VRLRWQQHPLAEHLKYQPGHIFPVQEISCLDCPHTKVSLYMRLAYLIAVHLNNLVLG